MLPFRATATPEGGAGFWEEIAIFAYSGYNKWSSVTRQAVAATGDPERPESEDGEKGYEDGCLQASCHRGGAVQIGLPGSAGQCGLCLVGKEGPSYLASTVLCSASLSHRGAPSWNHSEG